MMHTFGAVTNYRDDRKEFYKQYHLPYMQQQKAAEAIAKSAVAPEKAKQFS